MRGRGASTASSARVQGATTSESARRRNLAPQRLTHHAEPEEVRVVRSAIHLCSGLGDRGVELRGRDLAQRRILPDSPRDEPEGQLRVARLVRCNDLERAAHRRVLCVERRLLRLDRGHSLADAPFADGRHEDRGRAAPAERTLNR